MTKLARLEVHAAVLNLKSIPVLLIVLYSSLASLGQDSLPSRQPPNPGSAARFASDAIPAETLRLYEDLAVRWMADYLKIDTTNPPGNEMRAVDWMRGIFDSEGIENQVFEYRPGRGNIWARIPATTSASQRPLILLNHLDVVTSDPSHWKVPPFSAAVIDGVMYGRGAQDMKSEGLAQLMVLVMLKRQHVPLSRDIIFLATSDEEVDDTGTDWMIANHRDLLENAEFLITEGGENPRQGNMVKFIGIDVAEKSPFWLHIVAHGRPGHGSKPIKDSAPDRLVAALNRIVSFTTPYKVLPVVEESLRAQAAMQPADRARYYRDAQKAIKDRKFRDMVDSDESLNFMFHDTISLTMLSGSQQTNVIPSAAWANLDVRLLPGEDPKQFLEMIRGVVNDGNVSVDPLKPSFEIANASPTNTALYKAIQAVESKYYPGTPVVPHLSSGYTENQRFRQLGIVSYGFSPYTATEEEGASEHGDNERIRIEELRKGPRILYDVVNQLAGSK